MSHSRPCILSLFLIFLSACTTIKVHVPKTLSGAHEIQEHWMEVRSGAPDYDSKDPDIEIEFPSEDPARFVYYEDGFTSWTGWGKNYENLYGPISKLIRKELNDHKEDYPGKHKIIIQKFKLESIDHWTYNQVNVEMEADIISSGKTWHYEFKDGIESRVTDFMATLATVPILLGWIIHLPYMGHRGNREDQVNQMGRVALLDFMDEIKKHSIDTKRTPNKKGNK
ncbi:hypothetical protein [Leptospira andrefontaineae]|uniref:hypothetical protein n=1 Tax=Leptospira andrefontaineae TaxID=2484976 RepID=UPI001FC963F9|nr:hypothetical protein [Leptospira andrefontaineae]